MVTLGKFALEKKKDDISNCKSGLSVAKLARCLVLSLGKILKYFKLNQEFHCTVFFAIALDFLKPFVCHLIDYICCFKRITTPTLRLCPHRFVQLLLQIFRFSNVRRSRLWPHANTRNISYCFFSGFKNTILGFCAHFAAKSVGLA